MASYLSQSRTEKPVEALNFIMGKINNQIAIEKCKKNKLISLTNQGVKHCFILFEGDCVMIRSRDQRTMATLSPPIILGFTESISNESVFNIKANSNLSYALLPMSTYEKIIDDLNIWKEQTIVLKWLLSGYSRYINTIINNDNYQMACQLLRDLNNEKEVVRASITAATYIQERTLLSRSWIMNLLSNLKTGEFIEMHRGHLIKINKLPNKY